LKTLRKTEAAAANANSSAFYSG